MRVTLSETRHLENGQSVTRTVHLDGDPGELRALLTGRQPTPGQMLALECEQRMKWAILERSTRSVHLEIE